MKKKKVIALLIASTILATMPAYTLASPMVAYAADETPATIEPNNTTDNNNPIVDSGATMETNAGEVTDNNGEIATNTGTVDENDGKVDDNKGTVEDNDGEVITNESGATVETNDGTVDDNKGTVEDNNGKVINNESGATVETNDGTVCDNKGTIDDNNGKVITNESGATVTENDGTVSDNKGTVTTNDGKVINNYGTVTNSTTGTVNYNDPTGTVTTSDPMSIKNNCGTMIYKESESDAGTTYLAVYLQDTDNASTKQGIGNYKKEGSTASFQVPSSVSGLEILADLACSTQTAVSITTVDGRTLTAVDGKYILKPGDTVTINAPFSLLTKWRQIIGQQVGESKYEAAASSSSSSTTTSTPTPSKITTSIAGVEIKDWSDVSSVLTKMADKVQADETGTKMLKLELKQESQSVPADVITSLSSSSIDSLHCALGNGTAITFVNNGTLANYIPTDFTHTEKETDTMKTFEFSAPQEIGATIILSTTVPVKNVPVTIWMLKDGQYVSLGQFTSTATGAVAFPISETGTIVLTY